MCTEVQLRPDTVKLNNSNTLHRRAAVQTQPGYSSPVPQEHPALRVLPSFCISDVQTRQFLLSGRELPKPSLPLHFRQHQWPLGSLLVTSQICSGDISDLFWWPLVPSAPEWWGLANQERLAEVSGRSSWKRKCLEIPGGCWIQSVPPEVCRTLKLYQNHPQVHPSQSFPQPHPACLSFIDKKTRKKKKDFHRKLIITFSPPPLIFWHKCIRYSLQI